MKKRIFALLLVVFVVFILTGCSQGVPSESGGASAEDKTPSETVELPDQGKTSSEAVDIPPNTDSCSIPFLSKKII